MFIGFIRGLRFEIICCNFSWWSFCSFNASVWLGLVMVCHKYSSSINTRLQQEKKDGHKTSLPIRVMERELRRYWQKGALKERGTN